MQTQLLLQLARQPATAEQPRPPQFQAAQFHLQTVDRIGRNLPVVGKQTQIGILLLLIIKHRQRLAPCRLLLIVDLTEIEDGSLHRLVGSNTMVFYDAEVAMILASFLRWIQRRNMLTADCQNSGGKGKTLGLHSTVFQSSTMKAHNLTMKMMEKIAKAALNCEGWVSARTSVSVLMFAPKATSTM
jgi:hypothetical protein